MSRLLAVALNGSRSTNEHPAIPRTAQELAGAARAPVEAGAQILHLHAYDSSGIETLTSPQKKSTGDKNSGRFFLPIIIRNPWTSLQKAKELLNLSQPGIS